MGLGLGLLCKERHRKSPVAEALWLASHFSPSLGLWVKCKLAGWFLCPLAKISVILWRPLCVDIQINRKKCSNVFLSKSMHESHRQLQGPGLWLVHFGGVLACLCSVLNRCEKWLHESWPEQTQRLLLTLHRWQAGLSLDGACMISGFCMRKVCTWTRLSRESHFTDTSLIITPLLPSARLRHPRLLTAPLWGKPIATLKAPEAEWLDGDFKETPKGLALRVP